LILVALVAVACTPPATPPPATPPAGTGITTTLPVAWHLTSTQTLTSVAGTVSGTQPRFLLKFGSPPRSWITGQLTGTYAAGVWTAKVFTQPVTTATSLQSRLYRKGTGAEVLIGTAQADIDLANGTNHATVFSFTGVPELTLAGETLRLELTKLSGPIVTLIANGSDFDSRLETPVVSGQVVTRSDNIASTSLTIYKP
jgi:hypothetical protein